MVKISFNLCRKPEIIAVPIEIDELDKKLPTDDHVIPIEKIQEKFSQDDQNVDHLKQHIMSRRAFWKFMDLVTYIMIAFIATAVLISCINFVIDVSHGKPMGVTHVYYVCVGLSGSITILFYISEYESQERRLMKLMKHVTPKFAFVFQGCKHDTPSTVLLRVRAADRDDNDYVEIEFDKENCSYLDLVDKICLELGVDKDLIVKLLKYPETKIRNDADVRRFKKLEYIDVVTKYCFRHIRR